jgi:cyclopropane fatty-acyl-phospholipid synthase-like methyltransferase
MTVLDVGCGSGFFTRLVAEGFNGGKVCGIDMDLAHITEAKKIAEAKGLSGKIEFI